MNKIIKQELYKCRRANIPGFDDSTTHIQIFRGQRPEMQLCLNGYYLIKLADYVINEPENFSLSYDWNQGTKPTTHYNKVQVNQLRGKMVNLTCVGYDYENQKDLNNVWTGWVPFKSITILTQLE